LVKNAKFLIAALKPGEGLYIPPGWYHYVEAEAAGTGGRKIDPLLAVGANMFLHPGSESVYSEEDMAEQEFYDVSDLEPRRVTLSKEFILHSCDPENRAFRNRFEEVKESSTLERQFGETVGTLLREKDAILFNKG
jgi:ribosomal protein L16 Arg81 hydroxylase